MANRYWVGGTGTWDGTSTANWSASSGGASGASVPTTADSVFFDQAGTYTVTLTGTLTCLDLTVSAGTVTFTSTGTLIINGSLSLVAGTVWSATGTLNFTATASSKTLTTNGTTINGNVTCNGVGGVWTLGSALTLGAFNTLTLNSGTFSTSASNYAVTTGFLTCNNTGVTRVLNFNASTVTLTASASTLTFTSSGLTFNAGTSQINCTGFSLTFAGGGLTFYNVGFGVAMGGDSRAITGANTFNNLSFVGPSTVGLINVTFDSNQTINGTLSTTGTAGNQRVFFASATYGIGYTFTVNSAPSLTDADFCDIYVIGTAAPISGTRIGNRGNCTGITFSTPKTVYWNLAAGGNWSDNAWATSSGGTVSTDNFPLPQDTATIVNTGLTLNSVIALDGAIPYVGSINMSARTVGFIFSFANATTCYGNWANGSGVIIVASTGLTFSGGNTQTITSAGKAIGPITVDTYGGTVQLADALNIGTSSLVVTNGTFTTAGFAVTCGQLSSSNSNVRTINLGASTVTLSSVGTFINFTTNNNLTFNAGTSTIVHSVTSSGGITPFLGNFTYYNLTLSNSSGGTLTYTLNGQVTFNNLTFSGTNASANIQILQFTANATINGTLTCAGASAVRRISVQSNTIGTQRTLTVNSLSATDCDFRDIVIAGTAAGSSPTRAGDCGNNSGITFPVAKTVYWNLAGSQNWSATAWCTASGGTPAVNNFPLAQDTAVFDDAGSAGTVTIELAWNIGTFDASGRTSAMSLSIPVNPPIYGDWKFGSVNTTSNATLLFSKFGTQTITSNGVSFSTLSISSSSPNTVLQLADAYTSNTTSTISATSGSTFDAVTYNVTTGLFSGANSILKMGSGTWTLSGIGTVWLTNISTTLYAGTSTVVLSNTSTTARTFDGGGLYYNKLTIGGTTGISQLNIASNNTFGELASTKTVAHTIAFGTTTQNFGKWSVTGTVGNVVTITGTDTNGSIYGPAVTGVDYLAMGTWGISTVSPGEFYAGANSTGTAVAPVYRTAAPTPRTLYWVNGTGNWSSTANWSTSSGGGGGFAIPTSLDSVIFNSASNAGSYTTTVNATSRCASFTMAGPASGTVAFAGSFVIIIHGNVSFAATGITATYTGSMYLSGNSSYTFTTNGLTLSSSISLYGIGATWSLGSALSSPNAGSSLSLIVGTFDTTASNYAVTFGVLSLSSRNVRSIKLNGSTVTLASSTTSVSAAIITNQTFNAGTSQINFTSTSSTTINSGGLTFYNVSFTDASTTAITFTGNANTYNNLTFTGSNTLGIRTVSISADQTINGTLTLGAGTAAAYRTFLRSDTLGTPRTLTVNALAAGATDIDFRDITVTGSAAPLTGTRFGDAKGNSGITFPAAKTVYYRQTGTSNWGVASTGSWSATSGGALDATQFPLAQDTAVFPAATYPASGSTTTINFNYNIGTIDMSLRTSNTMTLATSTNTPAIYGNWINGTGITISGTGIITFSGRTTQQITSASKTFTQPIAINSPSGTVQLQSALTTSSTVATTLTNGTLNLNGFIYTVGTAFTTATGTKNLTFNGGTLACPTAATTAFNNAVPTGFTTTAGTGTGVISMTAATAKTFVGGGSTFNCTLNQGGLGTLTISGNNTFANITKTAVGAATISLAATTQTVGAFTAAGTAGNLLTITGTSAASPATLVKGAGAVSGLDYLVPTFVRAYSTTSTWYAGANSTNGGSLGWIFSTYVPPVATTNGNFLVFF